MTRHTLPPILLLAVCLVAPLHAQETGDPIALPLERYELDNGLEVVLLPDSTRDGVAVELWTHVGTRHEPIGKYGTAHFFEHALSHGALMRTGAVAALADSLRTGSNARTRDDYTRYYQKTTRAGTGLFLLMASYRLASDPAIDLTEERIESQRERVLAEMARWEDHRWGEPVSARLAAGTFGPTHPYGHDGYGTPAETRATTRDDLVRWQRAHVRPEYTTLFVAGDFDSGAVRDYVELVFGRIPGGERPPREAPRVPAARGGRDSLQIAADSSHLFLAWPTPQWAHEDAPLLELFGRVLEERLRNGLPAGVGEAVVEPVATELAGSFTIRLTHAPDTDAAAVEAWTRGVLATALDEFGGPELETARSAEREYIAGFHEQLGWIGGRIELVGESLVFADDPLYYLDRIERQERARPGDVSRVAREWLGAEAFVFVVEGTGGQADR